MKRRITGLCLALAMVLILLPVQVAGAEEQGVTDYSQYLTDNIISKEELTVGGTPFYELSIDEAIAKIPPSLLSIGNYTHRVHVDERNTEFYRLDICQENGMSIMCVLAFEQEDGSSTLHDMDYFGGYRTPRQGETNQQPDVLDVKTEIRGISSADSTETILKKLGVTDDGSKTIATMLQKPNTYFNLTTGKLYDINNGGKLLDEYPYNEYGFAQRRPGDDGGLSHIFFYDDDIRFQMNFFEGHISYFRAWKGGPLAAHQANVKPTVEYEYDTPDLGENTNLPTNLLDNITDVGSATDAVKQMVNGMTIEQKSSATGVDLATLYAETATAKAVSKEVEGGEVIISAASVADLESKAEEAVSAVETALVNGGVTTARYLTNTVTLTTDETGEITIKIDPDILTTEVDKIRVETPTYALTLKVADLEEDLTEVLTITAEDVGSGFAPGKGNSKTSVKVNLPKGRTTNPVTISLSSDSGATTYQAIVKTDGTATASKYNPATTTMDGKINTSGTYTVQTNEKSFTDISNKSTEMQKAILYLTSKGIINGTSATQFSPDGTINRQQIAALLMRALGKVGNTAKPTFTDVPSSSSFYHAIASSQKHKVVNGYSDNTFRGANVISRAQIVTVAGRVLTTEMNYKTPSNASTYLAKYSDTVPEYAREMVALATRENLVVYRTDGTFSGDKNMTRGDAAIILYRLFQKIW